MTQQEDAVCLTTIVLMALILRSYIGTEQIMLLCMAYFKQSSKLAINTNHHYFKHLIQQRKKLKKKKPLTFSVRFIILSRVFSCFSVSCPL